MEESGLILFWLLLALAVFAIVLIAYRNRQARKHREYRSLVQQLTSRLTHSKAASAN